jgi:hypothetical protein
VKRPGGEEFRRPDEISLPDPRMEHLVVPSSGGNWRQLELCDWHSAIERVRLNDYVPDDIWSHFETARNLALYSWFVYRFQSAAEMQALASLEFALRERCRREGDAGPLLLGRLFRHAIDQRWFRAECLSAFRDLQERRKGAWEARAHASVVDDQGVWQMEPGAFLEQVRADLIALRNEWAHGSDMLKGQSIMTLKLCGELINQLFPDTALVTE